MNRRFVLFWLVLLALAVAPFGRLAAAEAMARPHQPAAAAGHCADMPADPDQGDSSHKAQIDCLSACAAMATAGSALLPAFAMAASPRNELLVSLYVGLDPEADPPPPRRS